MTRAIGPSPGHPHTHTVILLHGRDSEAKEFAAEHIECEASLEIATPGTEETEKKEKKEKKDGVEHRTLTALFPTVKWVFPQATPLRSERFEMDLSQWFDIWAVERPQERAGMQVGGLAESIKQVAEVVKTESGILQEGICGEDGRGRVLLGGISMGFATAISAVLAESKGGFAGLIGWSSWLPEEALKLMGMEMNRATGKGMPVFLGHCRNDEVVSVTDGEALANRLGELGFKVEWRVYEEGGHWINEPEGVDDFVEFLRGVIVE